MDTGLLSKTKLFAGMNESDILTMVNCLSAVTKSYGKGEYIYECGDYISKIGLVMKGSVLITSNDIWGNQKIVEHVSEGQMFGESYASKGDEPMLVNVEAAERTEVLFLDIKRVMTVCSSACLFHTQLIQNMLSVLAGKNLQMMRKIDCLAERSIRERILSYLSYQAMLLEKRKFRIPFNRQQMADYLSVDRSALSNELSKMQKEGILAFEKNEFTLYSER